VAPAAGTTAGLLPGHSQGGARSRYSASRATAAGCAQPAFPHFRPPGHPRSAKLQNGANSLVNFSGFIASTST
jgi:hypothetical protein